MDNTQIYYACLTTAVFHHSQTIYSLATMWTGASSRWKRYVCCWLTKSNIQKISSSYVAIMSALVSTESMVSGDFASLWFCVTK